MISTVGQFLLVGFAGVGVLTVVGTLWDMGKEFLQERRGERILTVTWRIPMRSLTANQPAMTPDVTARLEAFLKAEGIRVADEGGGSQR